MHFETDLGLEDLYILLSFGHCTNKYRIQIDSKRRISSIITNSYFFLLKSETKTNKSFIIECNFQRETESKMIIDISTAIAGLNDQGDVVIDMT